MKVCVLTQREALLLERDGKVPVCFDPAIGKCPHRHIDSRHLELSGYNTALVIGGPHEKLEIRFLGDNLRRAVWIPCRVWRIVKQTKIRGNREDLPRRFAEPGRPNYQLVSA